MADLTKRERKLLERIAALEDRIAELEARPPQVINHYHTHYHPAPELPQPQGPFWNPWEVTYGNETQLGQDYGNPHADASSHIDISEYIAADPDWF